MLIDARDWSSWARRMVRLVPLPPHGCAQVTRRWLSDCATQPDQAGHWPGLVLRISVSGIDRRWPCGLGHGFVQLAAAPKSRRAQLRL